MSEFNLSDKICTPIPRWDGIYFEDVKQFIRLLKETERCNLKTIILIPEYCAGESHLQYAVRYSDILLKLFKERIDKLAGEKLI
jgi:hypothetical protein